MSFPRGHLWLVVIAASLAVMFCLGFVWAVMLLPDQRLREYAGAQPEAPSPTPWPVWVTTGSGFYHRHGTRWYGRSFSGRFVSEQQALAEGKQAAGN